MSLWFNSILFPGHRAGASLKVVPIGAATTWLAGTLPRPPSRGLIEGVKILRNVREYVALFPGHRAGASLKGVRCWERRCVERAVSSPATEPGPH